MKEWRFGEIEQKEWDFFEREQLQRNMLQAIARKKVRSKMGYETWILGVKKNKKVLAGALILVRDGVAWLAYGPIMDWKKQNLVRFYFTELEKMAKTKGWLVLEVFPYILEAKWTHKGQQIDNYASGDIMKLFADLGYKYSGKTTKYEMKAHRWMFVKDLSQINTLEELRAGYRKTLRARLKKVEGALRTRKLTRKELGILVELVDSSDAYHGIKGRDLEYYRYIYDSFAEDAEFLVAEKKKDNTVVAGAVFIRHENEMVSFLSGMKREYREMSGRAWLQDYQMQECLKRKINRINFYWIEGKFENNSLLEFKSAFGGEVEEYIGKFVKVLKPTEYKIRKLRGRLSRVMKKIF